MRGTVDYDTVSGMDKKHIIHGFHKYLTYDVCRKAFLDLNSFYTQTLMRTSCRYRQGSRTGVSYINHFTL